MDDVVTMAAAAVVQQMALDGWSAVRDRFAAFLARRSGASEDAVGAELDTSRAELTAAREAGDEEAAGELETAWRGRFRRAVRDDAAGQEELALLVSRLTAGQPAVRSGDVHNTINGGTYQGPVIQAGSVGRMRLDGRS
ncbi:hypothetical protein [Streptomyces montanisoli]|uniref:Uncharacterized protein n=1 Tax=Streptomyces montanisoli TaxID=2798581 RepID=A0A940MJ40_9ACTN|nr:hypothetical protein [Streptomyces montanisoli]MBP0461758.1 hypothetical protein [Streptomyces montanisoli]